MDYFFSILLLELDALVGPFQVDVKRFAQPVRVVPHAAEHGELDDLLLRKVLLIAANASSSSRAVMQRDAFGPAYRRLLAVVEIGRAHIVVALRRLDLRLRETDLLSQRHVMRHAIGALVERRGLDDHELLDLHVVRIGLDVGEADALVRQHPARQRGRLVGQHLREIADPAPLPHDAVVDRAGVGVGVLRLDHLHARHGRASLLRGIYRKGRPRSRVPSSIPARGFYICMSTLGMEADR